MHLPTPHGHAGDALGSSTARRAAAAVLLLLASASASSRTHAQSTPQDTTIDRYARANLAIASLRDSVQAALADFRHKKPDEQAKLRGSLTDGSRRILERQGLTDRTYRDFLVRVSTEDSLRLRFDSALVRLAPKH